MTVILLGFRYERLLHVTMVTLCKKIYEIWVGCGFRNEPVSIYSNK